MALEQEEDFHGSKKTEVEAIRDSIRSSGKGMNEEEHAIEAANPANYVPELSCKEYVAKAKKTGAVLWKTLYGEESTK